LTATDIRFAHAAEDDPITNESRCLVYRLNPRLAALLASISLTGCVTVTPEHVPLSAQARGALASTEVVLPVVQSEIYIDVPASNISQAAGGGLLPALLDAGIDSVRASNAAKAVAPLRNAVLDFSFDDTLSDAFGKALVTPDGLQVSETQVVKDGAQSNLDGLLAKAKPGDVLIVTTNYHLANDGGSLWIEAHAALYGVGQTPAGGSANHPSAPANALYRNTIWFTTTVHGATTNRTENVALWSANHGELLRADLKEGAAKVAQLIANDLKNPDTAAAGVDVVVGRLEHKPDGTEVFRAG
jgi:hypothetical protein